MAAQDCTFKDQYGVFINAEASFIPGFRAHPTIFLETKAGYVETISFATVEEFRKFLKMLIRLDEQIGVYRED